MSNVPPDSSRRVDAANLPPGTAATENIDCTSLAAPSGADVLGVSVGMRADDAYRIVACSNRAMKVWYGPGSLYTPAMPDGTEPHGSITGQAPGEAVEVLLVGAPGQETVAYVRRQIYFPSDEWPQVATLRQQLLDKYGSLTDGHATMGYTGSIVRPAYASARLPPLCVDLEEMRIHEECGPSVAVYVQADRYNLQLADRLVVAISDGGYGMRQYAAYRAQAETAAHVGQARETEEAAGRRPSL